MNKAPHDVDVRTMRLWREPRWHCDCGRVRSRWIAHLYFEDVIVEECSFDLLSPMLRMAHAWRTAVTTHPAAVVLVHDAQGVNERHEESWRSGE